MATFTATAASSTSPARYDATDPITRVVQRSVAVALSAGDVYQMMKVPNGANILDVTLVADLFGGGNVTTMVGDGISTGRYFSSLSPGASSVNRLATAGAFGYSYSAEDTIDIVFSTVTSASAVGVVKLIVTYTNAG